MLSPHGSQTQSESHPCISYVLTVFTSVTVTGRPLDMQAGWKIRLLLISHTWDETAYLISHGRRWGNMRGISCRSELKMVDVVPPQIPNLYSHLDLSPIFPLSSWACYS